MHCFLRLCLLLCVSIASLPASADDWPQWGGPQGDCVWRETGIVDKLPKGLLPRKWSTPIGAGYSGPAVADGRVYVTDRQQAEETERVLCLDAETGKVLWKHEYPVTYTIQYPAGPRATPVIADGRVYTIGAEGDMYCLDAQDGKVRWQSEPPDDDLVAPSVRDAKRVCEERQGDRKGRFGNGFTHKPRLTVFEARN